MANTDSAVPACCRRAGKHHCAMAGDSTRTSASGVAIRAASESCPFYLIGRALPAQIRLALLAGSAILLLLLFSGRNVLPELNRGYARYLHFLLPQRGPPAFVL
jgi:hypothetical protein